MRKGCPVNNPYEPEPVLLKFEVAMTKSLLTIALLAVGIVSFGQARLVLNNDAWVVIDNGAFVVIDHANPNGIQTLGTGGNISSENENDRIRWNIRNGTGNFVIPYTNPAGVKMPFSYNVPSGGQGSNDGSVVFSTYNWGALPIATRWDNDLYRPTDVTHMLDWATGSVNNSGYVVDRFWIVDTQAPGFAYAANPSPRLTFVYDNNDVTVNNAIAATAPLGAQRFNNGAGQWGDMLPIGAWADLGATKQVSTLSVPAADMYRSWTLSDLGNPLPIELVSFEGRCESDHVTLTWVTASEIDNDYFTVEKSLDGVEYTSIGTVQGAGNSFGTMTYTFVDEGYTDLAYYRLKQTDFDGTTTTGPTVPAGCDQKPGTEIVNVWDDGSMVNVLVSASNFGIFDVTLHDGHGKQLTQRTGQAVERGITLIQLPKNGVATGMYLVRLSNPSEQLSRKAVLN